MTKLAVLFSRGEFGVSAPQVRVEVHISKGMPGLSIVGMAETAVKESKDRVRAAIINSGYEFPQHRITINLSPADIPKQGGRYDLPIALGILAAAGQLKKDRLSEFELIGELALGGQLRPIRGILPVVAATAAANRSLIVPKNNAEEAAMVSSCNCFYAENLLQVCAYLDGVDQLPKATQQPKTQTKQQLDLADVKGQEQAKRALIIAAAGGHNLLFYGPPGTGKTMLASRISGILPPLSKAQALQTAKVASISNQGFNPENWGIPPFQSPHHTASAAALVGGGSNPMPGEISLAHNGVLFLDELPEFSRHVLEVLREPMESGRIVISRATRSAEFPARFQLITSLNPCPCGYFGDSSRDCHCSPGQIQHYRNKISGPLLDRIDLQVEVPRVSHQQLRNTAVSKPQNQAVRRQVINSRKRQWQRNNGKHNAILSVKEIEQTIVLKNHLLDFLEQVCEQLKLSARAYHRIIKVARTIADLDNQDQIQQTHITEAISYRSFDRGIGAK